MSIATFGHYHPVRDWAAHYRTLTARELVARTLSLRISVRRGNVSEEEVQVRFAALEAEQARRATVSTPELPIRRGTRVLALFSDGAGIGTVEGEAFKNGRRFPVVRWSSEGYVSDRWGAEYLVAVDSGTVLVEDQFNNVGRRCNVRGDGAAGEPCRAWRVVSAVSGSRYLVANLHTSRVRVVDHRDMTNLY